jgi:hypothetical protein
LTGLRIVSTAGPERIPPEELVDDRVDALVIFRRDR